MDAGRTETRIYAAVDHDARLANAACRPDSARCDEKPSLGSFSELSAVDWSGGPRGADGRGSRLRVSCALADDHQSDAAADSRDRAGGGETDSHRNGHGNPVNRI